MLQRRFTSIAIHAFFLSPYYKVMSCHRAHPFEIVVRLQVSSWSTIHTFLFTVVH